ncbi:MAG: hypothetical protein HGA51_05495 [Demequinaceae bacterium]|nr:hypothetical protein [Demequinaceae bacterium]
MPPTSGDNEGTSSILATVVPGAPLYSGGASAPEDGTTATIATPPLQVNYSALPAHEVWMAWSVGNPTCTMTAAGDVAVSGGDVVTSTTSTISGLTANTDYRVSVCGTNGYGAVMAPYGDLFTWVMVAAPAGPIYYNVSLDAQGTSSSKKYSLTAQPSVATMSRFSLVYWYDGVRGDGTLTLTSGRNQAIRASYCLNRDLSKCGDKATVVNAAGTPVTTVELSVNSWCTDDPQAGDVATSTPSADRTIDVTTVGMDITYAITWTGDSAMLHATTLTRSRCSPVVVTPPSPSPSPAPVGP